MNDRPAIEYLQARVREYAYVPLTTSVDSWAGGHYALSLDTYPGAPTPGSSETVRDGAILYASWSDSRDEGHALVCVQDPNREDLDNYTLIVWEYTGEPGTLSASSFADIVVQVREAMTEATSRLCLPWDRAAHEAYEMVRSEYEDVPSRGPDPLYSEGDLYADRSISREYPESDDA